jgi:membrane protein DedA with SNARE-associated domain
VELPALAFLAAVLTVKEAGVPIPVPGDLLVIGAGASAARGGIPAAAIVVVLIAATVIGGAVQFALLRGRARTTLLRSLARVGLGEASIERGTGRLRSGGARTVAVARMTPGVRIVAIASSAIAGVSLTSFLAGLLVGNGVFLTGHFLLGLLLGQPAIALVSSAGTGLLVLGIAFAVLGGAGWWLIARRRAAGRARATAGSTVAGRPALDWTDACCPACLALALIPSGGHGEPAT